MFDPKLFVLEWKRSPHVNACAVGVVQDVLPVDDVDVVFAIEAS